MTCCATEVGDVGARLDLKIRQGAEFLIELTLSAGGVAIDLTGFSLRAQMRKTGAAAAVAATFDCVVTVAAEGKATVGLTSAVTALITAGESLNEAASRYVWDLELVEAGSPEKVTPLLYGEVRVQREVTRGP